MPDKKIHENQVFRLFQHLLDDFPKGKVVQTESPDFLIRLNRRKVIGVELTELHGQTFYDNQGHFEKPELLFYHLEETIQAKEEKMYLYQKVKPVELWLLIHLRSFQNQLNFHYRNKLDNWFFNSSFDRIYLLEEKKRQLHEIS
ncbi:hypothetical protein [Sunxiuqinia elliptica]|uniref:Uncharacterized protein n=1 Tax=Sunxiuqinia elliptica TaxID=655355 RepID=A0A4R6HA03_9BACT|nr:hypothetical protein [Sunxiuqinia elliptica]TDO04954.1 hypothetical protein DET52_101306 [Sunxiuqinia elliptica]TDO64502.1 hypothetical protein DET65_0864 [Sunxiuqinia elliptica]